MIRHSLVAATMVVVAVPLSAQQTFTAKPSLDIGGLMNNPAEELNNVFSVVRTTNGQYVVANGKPIEVRLYDSKGKMIRLLGRAGSGPGEFRSGASVYPWNGDSILTRSSGTRRWMLFGLNGVLVREWPVDSTHPVPSGTVLRNWAFTRTTIIGSRGCAQSVVEKLPVPSPWQAREAETDPAGRVWVHMSDVLWQIYSPTGTRLGTLTLPAHFTIMQFSGDLVIGLRIDDDEAEHITVVQVAIPAAPAAPALCNAPPVIAPAVSRMRIDAGNLRTAGEAVRTSEKGYPTSVPTSLVVLSPESNVEILNPAKDSWVAVLRDKNSSLHCMFSVGPHGIPGWSGGDVACSN